MDIFQNEVELDSVKPNKYISDDLITLKKHYTLLLDYISVLEKRNDKLKIENERLNQKIYLMENTVDVNSSDTEFLEDVNDWFW